MVALRQERWHAARFLDWLGAQRDRRFELEMGSVIERSAERARHARMKFSAAKALEAGIPAAELECQVWPNGMSVVIDDTTVRLPDAAVQCVPVDGDSTILEAPIIVVEVISPSSVDRDENAKLIEYFSLSSVEHYLLLSPERRAVVHFRRQRGSDRIETRILTEGLIELSPPGLTVEVASLLGPALS